LLVAHMTQHLILMSVVPPFTACWAHQAVPLLRSLPRSVLRDGLGPFFRAQSLHRIHPIHHPSGIRVVGHEYRLHRVACPPGLRTSLALSPGWHAVEHACFLGAYFALLASHSPALAHREPWVPLGHVALSGRRGPVNTGLAAVCRSPTESSIPAMLPDPGSSAYPPCVPSGGPAR